MQRSVSMVLRAVACALVLVLAACSEPRVFVHEAYVWQRQWDASLVAALEESRATISGLRVLGLQLDARARWLTADVDVAALAADPRGATLVVRLEGAAPTADPVELAARIDTVLARWREAGIAVRGVELDHDCATARLPAYAELLHAVRAQLHAGLRITITGLPDWLTSPELERVLQAADASVLQVHAVQSPERGLFDGEQAQRWIDAWSARSGTRPFAVALPAYRLRLHLDADGAVQAVESEQRLERRSAAVRDIAAEPADVAALLRTLERDAPANLSAVHWFRLPRDRDDRAWAWRTLRAVIRAEPLAPAMAATLAAGSASAYDVALRSTGTLDAALPSMIRVDGACAFGDGINGYRYRSGPAGGAFERDDAPRLPPGRRLAVGWVRCEREPKVRVGMQERP